MRTVNGVGILALAIAAMVGCSNPTANKPKATVSEPTPEESTSPLSEQRVTQPAEDPGLQAEGTPYFFDNENGGIDFEGYKVTGSHTGGFGEFEGTVVVPEGDLGAATIKLTIDMQTLYSDDPQLTDKLKSDDFFDVEKYPQSTFTSTKLEQYPDGSFGVTGDLTMHGITKRVTFPATIELDGDDLKTEAEFTINRFDWNINYKGVADDLIRKDVLIFFAITARPKDAP